MNKELLLKYDSNYQKLIVERYYRIIPEKPQTSEEYSLKGIFQFILEAPFYYRVEDEMFEYAKIHTDASVFDMNDYFDSIVTPGTLPPDADEWDDEEEEEEYNE